MGQTKRKRRTKHRGTQGGTVEARGRTSRPGSRAEARRQINQQRAQRRLDRVNRPPTWRGSIVRAGLSALLFFVLISVLFHQPVSATLPVALGMFLIYVPAGYYMDIALHRRRQRRAG